VIENPRCSKTESDVIRRLAHTVLLISYQHPRRRIDVQNRVRLHGRRAGCTRGCMYASAEQLTAYSTAASKRATASSSAENAIDGWMCVQLCRGHWSQHAAAVEAVAGHEQA
jgi:hypothetical protein